jgi:hypothetical protein
MEARNGSPDKVSVAYGPAGHNSDGSESSKARLRPANPGHAADTGTRSHNPQRYLIASTSQAGVSYVITADGADVHMPGIRVPGQCQHARDVKTALAAGSAVPAVYVPDAAV